MAPGVLFISHRDYTTVMYPFQRPQISTWLILSCNYKKNESQDVPSACLLGLRITTLVAI